MAGVGLIWDLLAKDGASPAFLRVAGAADKAAASTARASASMDRATARMGRTGATMTKRLTLPLLAVGAVSVNQAMKYQKSLNTIQVATGRTSAQMAAGSKGLLQIATETGTSVGKLTDSFYVASKSGLSVAKSLAVTKAAAQAAKTENADLATVTDGLTSVMASYGKTLRDPVRAMNEIIKGAGLAKTTTQDFTASLSNVVPIASSLGISFDQVAGAIATMTQHGETAQRATENLANLITNLAGQNNVASQALQQLGVNTIDLSKNLGKRGLTGSLNLVLDAINKHGKDGLIVTSAFKHAGVAAASLRTEIDHMPKSLQANAQAFDAGKMSYKDFYTFAKSLGGQQFQLAKGFINTEAQAKGFSNQLKSGNGNVRTLAATLQKSLGGVTGMRTALMLSGQSAATFAKSTAAVRKAAGETKGDVLGWATTQNTLAVKMDKAKASMQVMAIEIGSALIPAVSKLASIGTKAAHWVDGLSGTQKKVLLFSAGTLAALGPLLSMGAKLATVGRGIGSFVGGASTRLAALAGASEATAGRVNLAMRGLTSALAGAGVGYALGTLTKNSSTTTKAVGALASTATGAAIGFGAGGPLGAAIGGAAGLLTDLATTFTGTSDASRKAAAVNQRAQAEQQADMAATNSVAQNLLGTLESISGAYSKQYQQAITKQLSQQGALAIASQAGVKLPNLVSAVEGTGGSRGMAQLRAQLENATAAGKITWGQLAKVERAIGIVGTAATKTERELELEAAAMGHGVLSADQLGTSYKRLRSAMVGQVATLDNSTAAGKRNRQVVRENLAAINANAAAQLKHGRSVAAVASSVEQQIGALDRNAGAISRDRAGVLELIGTYAKLPKSVLTELRKRGVVPSDIQAIIDKYLHIPAARNTDVKLHDKASAAAQNIQHKLAGIVDRNPAVNLRDRASAGAQSIKSKLAGIGDRNPAVNLRDNASAGLQNILNKMAGIVDRTATVTVITQGITVGSKSRDPRLGGSASGTNGRGLPEGVSALGERGAELAIKHGPHVEILSNRQSRRFLAATGMRAPGFATGTKPDQGTLSSAVSSAIGNVGTAPSLKFNVADIGIARITAQIKHALDVLKLEIGRGLAKHTAAVYRSEITGYIREANRQLTNLRVRLRGSDVTALRRALLGTADDTRSAFSTILADVRAIGLATPAVTRALGAAQSKLTAVQNRLASARDYRSSVTDTLRGSFDSTQYGSVEDLLGGLGGATSTNKAYASEVSKLRAEAKGNPTLTAFVNQLAQSGQTATLQTLAGASKSELAQITKSVGAYDTSVTAGGNAAELTKFGVSVDQLTAEIRRDRDATARVLIELARIAARPIELDGKQLDHRTDKRFQAAMNELLRLLK